MSIVNVQNSPTYTGRGGVIRLLVTPKTMGSQNLIVVHIVLQPGEEFVRHRHEASEEAYYILEGGGLVVLGEERVTVKLGDAVYIPPKTEHSIINQGDQALILLATQAPMDEALAFIFK